MIVSTEQMCSRLKDCVRLLRRMQYPIAGLTFEEIYGRVVSHYPASIGVFVQPGLAHLVANNELKRVTLSLDGKEITTWRRPPGMSWRDTRGRKQRERRHRLALAML